jgi:hypothetical protein
MSNDGEFSRHKPKIPHWLDAGNRIAGYLRCHHVDPGQIPLMTSAIIAEARSRIHSDDDLMPVAMGVALERLRSPSSWPMSVPAIPSSAAPRLRLTHMAPQSGTPTSPRMNIRRRLRRLSRLLKLPSLAELLGIALKPTRAASR